MDYIVTLIILVGMGLIPIYEAIEWVVSDPLMFACYIALAASILFFLRWCIVYLCTRE